MSEQKPITSEDELVKELKTQLGTILEEEGLKALAKAAFKPNVVFYPRPWEMKIDWADITPEPISLQGMAWVVFVGGPLNGVTRVLTKDLKETVEEGIKYRRLGPIFHCFTSDDALVSYLANIVKHSNDKPKKGLRPAPRKHKNA